MSGGAWGFSEFPDEWRKLKADPGLAGNAAAEIIRYQTPVIYQRRTATRDVELGGEMIAAGDKVVMRYISGNRDESVFVDADRLQVDRPNARTHITFGIGPHRCLGALPAAMQLGTPSEEMVVRRLEKQTPVIYQRRTATLDVELGGEMIAAGDKVVMWYISGNRDESVFVDADRLQVDRPNARQHIAFGMGPHRCLGARLAEMQLRILWEEVLVRDLDIEILGPPTYAFSNLVRSPLSLRARIKS